MPTIALDSILARSTHTVWEHPDTVVTLRWGERQVVLSETGAVREALAAGRLPAGEEREAAFWALWERYAGEQGTTKRRQLRTGADESEPGP